MKVFFARTIKKSAIGCSLLLLFIGTLTNTQFENFNAFANIYTCFPPLSMTGAAGPMSLPDGWLFHRPHQIHGHFPHHWNFVYNLQKLLYLSGWSWFQFSIPARNSAQAPMSPCRTPMSPHRATISSHIMESVWVFHNVLRVSWCFTSGSWCFTCGSQCFTSGSWCCTCVSWCITMYYKCFMMFYNV